MALIPWDGSTMLIYSLLIIKQIPSTEVLLASFHREDKALVWFQDFEASSTIISWESFVQAFQTRFNLSTYKDPMKALTRL